MKGFGTFYMAGCPIADLNDILSFRSQGKLGVKSSNTKYRGGGKPHSRSDIGQYLFGKKTVFFLDFLENGN